ncbi:MAG: FKBP-type peptidyl-prolyl cis-trans isomerase N-terminal domain-containing protein, partial [Treponema sp.]|nr:FKBP-type peptidyl-prolyl cis-trans isomerase N-terminal domain-containing protein [Treponema sp.]
MKKIMGVLCFFAAAFALYGKGIAEDVNFAEENAQTSYAFGMIVGADLKQTGLAFDYAAFAGGFKDSSEGNARYTQEEAVEIVQTAFQAAMEKRAEENRRKEIIFLTENGTKDGVITTESGLQYEVLVPGTGD